MKKRIVAATICLCVIVLALQPVFAGRLSSLFWNDEAWYRDTMSPLLVREGEYFIPTGLLEMFDYITVRTPKDGNLLIYNSENENYISVLTEDGTAAVDGEIVSCAVFREAGTYYIGADLACSALGVRYDTYTDVDGTAVLRVYDSMAMYPFGEIVEKSKTTEDDLNKETNAIPGSYEDDRKRIYILCESDMCELLDGYGLEYTVFLDEEAEENDIYSAQSHGEIGAVYSGSFDALDRIRERIKKYTFTETYAVLSYGDEVENAVLKEKGYAVITPDVAVDERLYSDTVVQMIYDYLDNSDSVTVFLENTWSGKETARLISEFDRYEYATANIQYGE